MDIFSSVLNHWRMKLFLLFQDFVLKNNGEIWMESTEDVGSTFFFSLHIKGQEVHNVDR